MLSRAQTHHGDLVTEAPDDATRTKGLTARRVLPAHLGCDGRRRVRVTERLGMAIRIQRLSVVLGATLALSACSVAISKSGPDPSEVVVTTGLSREEVRNRLGKPLSATHCGQERHAELYRVRPQIPWPPPDCPGLVDLKCSTFSAIFLEVATAGIFEIILTPMALIEREKHKYFVTVLYDVSNRVTETRTHHSRPLVEELCSDWHRQTGDAASPRRCLPDTVDPRGPRTK